jgi:hypothetical protein
MTRWVLSVSNATTGVTVSPNPKGGVPNYFDYVSRFERRDFDLLQTTSVQRTAATTYIMCTPSTSEAGHSAHIPMELIDQLTAIDLLLLRVGLICHRVKDLSPVTPDGVPYWDIPNCPELEEIRHSVCTAVAHTDTQSKRPRSDLIKAVIKNS